MLDTKTKEDISRFEAIQSIEKHVEANIDKMLKPVDSYWQAADFIPDMGTEEGFQQWREMKTRADALPDELIIALVGDMITEEALPSYQTWINRLEGITDQTGTSSDVWSRWVRGWTCEENRHGDLLSQYLLLSGRVDMRSIQVTIQNLINNGFNPGTQNDPYLGFIYTSFQERATKISHRNTGLLAVKAGDKQLQRICAAICADEKRHEEAYQFFISKIFDIDPNGVILAFEKMMRIQIAMPARLMDDGQSENLFDSFSRVTMKSGVYTALDYADIVGHLVQKWDLANLKGLSNEAEAAREYLCKLAPRYKRLAQRAKPGNEPMQFSWLRGKTVYA